MEHYTPTPEELAELEALLVDKDFNADDMADELEALEAQFEGRVLSDDQLLILGF